MHRGSRHTTTSLLESAEFSVVINLLLTRVPGATRQHTTHFTKSLVDFFAVSSNFDIIAKFAVTPKDP
jgi:hypothetical protein